MDIDAVIDSNRAFAAEKAHEGLAMMPREFAMVIGCADPRVDPERVLGMSLGDVAVIRNIAGRVVPGVLDTLAGLGVVARRQIALVTGRSDLALPGIDVVVLHHTDCGILHLADDPETLAGFLGTDPERIADMHVTNPWDSVRHDVEVLRRSELLPGTRVWGLVYDVTTGLVEVASSPEAVTS